MYYAMSNDVRFGKMLLLQYLEQAFGSLLGIGEGTVALEERLAAGFKSDSSPIRPNFLRVPGSQFRTSLISELIERQFQ